MADQGFFPGWYLQRLSSPRFLILIPIVVNEKPICLIYVEGEKKTFDVSAAHFNYLRILQHQAVMAIRQKAAHPKRQG